MILLLDTSTPICKLTLVSDDAERTAEWEAGRELAKGLLNFLDEQLASQNIPWSAISGIGVFQGPGSFTGLRIGMTVLNTIADTLTIPIVTTKGEEWQGRAVDRLRAGDNDKLALPFYGGEANITQPRK